MGPHPTAKNLRHLQIPTVTMAEVGWSGAQPTLGYVTGNFRHSSLFSGLLLVDLIKPASMSVRPSVRPSIRPSVRPQTVSPIFE